MAAAPAASWLWIRRVRSTERLEPEAPGPPALCTRYAIESQALVPSNCDPNRLLRARNLRIRRLGSGRVMRYDVSAARIVGWQVAAAL